jgi:hypothetical protein
VVGVVVAVGAQGLAELGVVRFVAGVAVDRLPMAAGGSVAAGVAGLGSAVAAAPVAAGVPGDGAGVDRAEGGGGNSSRSASAPAISEVSRRPAMSPPRFAGLIVGSWTNYRFIRPCALGSITGTRTDRRCTSVDSPSETRYDAPRQPTSVRHEPRTA